MRLPAKTTSIKRWAERLREYAASSEVIAEADYWRAVDAATRQRLPLDNRAGANTVSMTEKVSVGLNEEDTKKLLKEVSRAYRTRINEVLVAGMEMGLGRWMRGQRVKMDVEGHGRQEIGEGVDVTRTVGWFTAIYPVVLELGEEEIGERLKRVKEEMRRVPGGGIGYGLLKYGDQQERRAGEQEEEAEIVFNYLGQVDQVMSEEGMFSLAPERSGETRSPRGERAYTLGVNAIVAGGRLQVEWDYSREQVSRDRIEELAQGYIESLKEIISHCESEEAGGYTGTDFPQSGLRQQQLDRFYEADKQIEDIYPLSPMQQGMLFHCMYSSEAWVYRLQLSCVIEGSLNA